MTLVTRITGACPKCGKHSFGNVSIGQQVLVRGCGNCPHLSYFPLPKIEKKILYLDQFFFSRAFRNQASNANEKFSVALERIESLASKQAIVTPLSAVHEDETYQWRGKDGMSSEDLMDFLKVTSKGVTFEKPYSIRRLQLLAAFGQYLKGDLSEAPIDNLHALPSDTNDWMDYLWIDAGGYWKDPTEVEQTKKDMSADLVSVISKWKHSQGSFLDQIEIEYEAAARNYFETYEGYLKTLMSGGDATVFQRPIDVGTIDHMLDLCPEELEIKERYKMVVSFFLSNYFREVPHEWISARIFALLREQVAQGAHKNPQKAGSRLRGIFDDIQFISTFAPYCDAIIVDGPMEAMLRDSRINLKERYGTLVFCERNWAEFEAWLEVIEKGISEEHLSALKVAYP